MNGVRGVAGDALTVAVLLFLSVLGAWAMKFLFGIPVAAVKR
jgi:hypothetical protein